MDKYEAESRLLYSIIVQGKSAKFAETVIVRLLLFVRPHETPFEAIKRMSDQDIDYLVREIRSGNYAKTAKAFREVVNLDAVNCTIEELQAIHGIGPKTSRFFLMWTREGQRYAALDVHILKWLRHLGHNAPKQTPTGALYAELESIFIEEANKRNMSPSDLDAAIWEHSSQRKPGFYEPGPPL